MKDVMESLKVLIAWADAVDSNFFCLTKGEGKRILKLLKEQEGIISALKSDLKETIEVVSGRLNVVRCKDCKHGKIHGIDVECVAHEEVGYDPEPWHPLDWYCADGERK